VTKNSKFNPFPKLLVFELGEHQPEYPKYLIRIYERKELDVKIQSSMIYFYLQGAYVNHRGQEVSVTSS
jgi:hypothetical protein